MRLIAHRGNTNGPSDMENHPTHIEQALNEGYDVEVDVWFVDGEFYLGHDEPTYKVEPNFLFEEGLWCHAKNWQALNELKWWGVEHYFWHQEDDFTLTSSGYIWTYPGGVVGEDSIAVMPEQINLIDKSIFGICSDYVADYENHPHPHQSTP